MALYSGPMDGQEQYLARDGLIQRAHGQISAPDYICIRHIHVVHGQEQYLARDGLVQRARDGVRAVFARDV